MEQIGDSAEVGCRVDEIGTEVVASFREEHTLTLTTLSTIEVKLDEGVPNRSSRIVPASVQLQTTGAICPSPPRKEMLTEDLSEDLWVRILILPHRIRFSQWLLCQPLLLV